RTWKSCVPTSTMRLPQRIANAAGLASRRRIASSAQRLIMSSSCARYAGPVRPCLKGRRTVREVLQRFSWKRLQVEDAGAAAQDFGEDIGRVVERIVEEAILRQARVDERAASRVDHRRRAAHVEVERRQIGVVLEQRLV